MDDAGLVGLLVVIGLVLVGAAVGTGAYLYATDFTLKADVAETVCLGPLQSDDANAVAIETRFLGLKHHVKGIPDQQCQLLSEGNYVEYRIRTRHTTIYEQEGGRCIYDSLTGVLCDALGR